MSTHSPVLLLGPSGFGKTTLGRHAAAALGNVKFHDLDHLVHRHTGVPPGQYLPKVGNFVAPSPGWLIPERVSDGSLPEVAALQVFRRRRIWVFGDALRRPRARAAAALPGEEGAQEGTQQRREERAIHGQAEDHGKVSSH